MVKHLPALQETLQYRAFDLIPGSGRSPGEGLGYPLQYSWASLMTQLVKKPPAIWETWVRSLGWEDPLEKGKATHPSIPAWRIPWGRKESETTERLSLSTMFLRFFLVVSCISTLFFFFYCLIAIYCMNISHCLSTQQLVSCLSGICLRIELLDHMVTMLYNI